MGRMPLTDTSTRCALQLRALVRTKASVKRWTLTKRRKSWMRSRTVSHGWIQIQRRIRRRSRRSIKRSRVFARQLYPNTTVREVVVEVKVVARRKRMRHTMSCREHYECMSVFVACAFGCEHECRACPPIGINLGAISKPLYRVAATEK